MCRQKGSVQATVAAAAAAAAGARRWETIGQLHACTTLNTTHLVLEREPGLEVEARVPCHEKVISRAAAALQLLQTLRLRCPRD